MNNEALFRRIKKLVSTERRIGVEILECLHEIDRRSAYAELRYDGLFTYCVKELGFTDFQAFQRIQAMRALREIPELKSMIETGSLSVSSVSKVQTHLRQEKKSGVMRTTTEKLGLFESVINCTSREVEAKLAEIRGEELKQKLVLELDEELQALWKQVKNLAAHRSQGDESEVLRILAKEWLMRNDPSRKAEAKSRVLNGAKSVQRLKKDIPSKAEPALRRTVPFSSKVPPEMSTSTQPKRYIPAFIRRSVWKRDGAKCTHCGSKHALEIDHRQAFALGGGNTEKNLRLLCRSCNRLEAVRVFGIQKIERMIRKS